MPSVLRRISILLAAACLSAGLPVAAAHAQGAGDQQYQDPFGSSSGSSGSGSSGSSSSGSSSSGSSTQSAPSLSSTPQASGASGTAGATASATAAPAAPAAQGGSAATLPSTGIDVRLVLLGGAVLLLTGLGLRLRSSSERS